MAPKFEIATVFSAIDKLTSPMKKMSKSTAAFSNTMKTLGKSAIALGAGAVGTALAVEKIITPFANKGDEIAKTSRMLGLSTDALQELRYAAGMQGVETELLDASFKKFNNSLGELKGGQGALYQRLSKTNPALARQLRTAQDTDTAFMLMMDAIKKETNVAKRATLAQSAFGKSGQDLIKFAEAGTEGIAELRKEAHKYGLVISQESAEASEQYSDSLTRLKMSAQGLFNQVLGQAVVKLQPLLQSMADWIALNKDFINQKLDSIFNAIGIGLNFITTPGVIEGLAALAVGIKAFAIASALLGATNPFTLAITALAGVITLIIANWGKISSFLDKLFGGSKTSIGVDGFDEFGNPISGTPLSSNSTITNSSTVDVNFNNLPQGTSIKQTGKAPGVNLNQGNLMGAF